RSRARLRRSSRLPHQFLQHRQRRHHRSTASTDLSPSRRRWDLRRVSSGSRTSRTLRRLPQSPLQPAASPNILAKPFWRRDRVSGGARATSHLEEADSPARTNSEGYERRESSSRALSPPAAACTSGGNSENSCTCRISITSFGDAGQRQAHSIASSLE